MHINKILVPVDFSPFSNKALEYATELAEKFNASLTLLHAVVLFQDDINEEEKLHEYEEWLQKREISVQSQMNNNKEIVNKKGLEIETNIIRGITAYDVILDFIHENSFDLVVMGTHGRTGLKHLFQGSVAEKVIRHSPIPVLTVHRSVKEFQIKKILVPIDFSEFSKGAVDCAMFIANKFASQIDILHVIEHEIHPSYYVSGIQSIFEVDIGLKNRVLQNMKEFLADQINEDILINFHVCEGKAHKEIIEYAKDSKTDLIVIATHGLTGLEYILLGSTTEKVVRWANCPVLTVKLNQ